jgi:hypothetical protein
MLDGEIVPPQPDVSPDAMLMLRTAAKLSGDSPGRGATTEEIIAASGLDPERALAAIEELIRHDLIRGTL